MEGLKARDQTAWVGAMNSIKVQTQEIVIHQIVLLI